MYTALIVEDDPQVAQINADFLTQAHFSVVGIMSDVQQALERLQSTPVNLLLLDIYLPGGNGLQVLRELRSRGQPIEVIVISAAKDSTQIREAFRMGCLDYVIKPFTYERLSDALKKYHQKALLLRKDFLSQSDVDLLSSQQSVDGEESSVPKGIERKTLHLITACILKRDTAFGVQDIVEQTQISRVSCKKYLDYLCEERLLQRTYIYGNKGRPANLYRLLPSATSRLLPLEE